VRKECKPKLPKRTLRDRGIWTRRSWVLGGVLAVVALASIYEFALAQQIGGNADKTLLAKSTSDYTKSTVAEVAPPNHEVTPEERALSWKTEFGQFPPYTEAERELEKMLRGKDEDIDLALANWLIAVDIPQLHEMTREDYFKQLDAMAEQVRLDIARQAREKHPANPNKPIWRCGSFAYAIHKLGFAYTEEFRKQDLSPAESQALHSNANDVFLVGLLHTQRGSCISMPLIYLVIGQRLGYPVHLVVLGKHYFIRWQEPGFRVNIEPTINDDACLTDDENYLEIEGMTRDQLSGSDLRNLTNREVVGQLFYTRSGYWAMNGPKCRTQCCLDISRAQHLVPEDSAITKTYQTLFNHYGIKPEHSSIEIRIGSNG
jgi:hypothetical protein